MCETCFNLGTCGASDKWRKSVKSMLHSLVYIGFDRHPSQMTQHSFKRVKNELYCHAWFKTKHAETAKHRDVENGQNRWYLHTPMVPYGLGCHYLLTVKLQSHLTDTRPALLYLSLEINLPCLTLNGAEVCPV